jgi:hypothetical protein
MGTVSFLLADAISVLVGCARDAVAEEQYSWIRALSSPTQAVSVQEHATSGVPAAIQAL